MLAAIALTPAAPVLIPALSGAAAAEVADLTEGTRAAATTLLDSWIAVGVGPVDQVVEPETRGTFAGYGADLPVAFGEPAPERVTALPLCALIAGWLRGPANPSARVQARLYSADLDAQTALARGCELRSQIDADPEPIGMVPEPAAAAELACAAPYGVGYFVCSWTP